MPFSHKKYIYVKVYQYILSPFSLLALTLIFIIICNHRCNALYDHPLESQFSRRYVNPYYGAFSVNRQIPDETD